MNEPKKIQVEVISLEADKLKAGSKYIFLVDPRWGEYISTMYETFNDMQIGKFTIIPIPAEHFKAYEITEVGGDGSNE